MTCFRAKRYSAEYVDGALAPAERGAVDAHLSACRSCSAHFGQMASTRSALNRLPSPAMPPLLATRLRVLASRERSSLVNGTGSPLQDAILRWKRKVREFMEPITIPATGGLLSSLLLFATLAVSVTTSARAVGYEVPVFSEQSTETKLLPVDMKSSVVVTMSLDNNGRIEDYAVRDGAGSYGGDGRGFATSSISMPQFPAVLKYAQPIRSDIRISFTPIVYRQ